MRVVCRLLAVIVMLALASIGRAATIRVSAAVSLKETLSEIAGRYTAETGDRVELTFGSSGQLLAQIKSGVDADVFISAAEKQMDDLVQVGLADAGSRRIVARNTLVLVVPANAAAPPESFAALAMSSGKVAIGEPVSVPAGAYAMETLTALKLAEPLKDRLVYGANVRQVLTYVERGEVLAGVVYLTDAKTSGDKIRIVATAAESTHSPIVYPGVVLKNAKNAAGGASFLGYLTGEKAAPIWQARGFGAGATTAVAPQVSAPSAGAFFRSFVLSIEIALTATAVVVLIGLPVAYLLARRSFPGRSVLEGLLILPLALPPTVVGYALLTTFGRNGWIGSVLSRALDYSPVFRFEGAVLASAIVAFPLLYMPAKASFRSVDRDLEDIARIFGASRLQRFWHVSLPLARRGIASGMILAFARALGEFGATLMVFGWQPGKVTLPISIYSAYEQGDLAAAGPAVIALAAISLLLIIAYNRSLGGRGE